MATQILGLPSSAKFAAEGDRFYNHRRKILHVYPNGGAPLTGILSMMPEESTNDSIFYWYEKHWVSVFTTLRGTNPCTTTAPSTGDADDGNVVVAGAKDIVTDFYLKVNGVGLLKVGDILDIATNAAFQFYVMAITKGVSDETLLGYVKVRLQRAATIAANPSTVEFATATRLNLIGNAMGEGSSGAGKGNRAYRRPFPIMNTTQIFEEFFQFPGSVLQMGAKWDKTGFYKERANDAVIDHMVNLEKSLIWGKRSTTSRASFDSTQENLSVRTMSGIIEYLELWDAGSTGLSIDGSTYAPYSFRGAAVSADTDDDKRIIANTAGTISVGKFNGWAERISRYHSNKTNEKLILCGSGAVLAFEKMFRMSSSFNVKYGDKAYGLDITSILTPFGTFHLVTHPLFSENSATRNWALFLDIWSLKYRYLQNRDTRLLKNLQNNKDDFREDGYRTEASMEFWNPRGNMLVKNISSYIED